MSNAHRHEHVAEKFTIGHCQKRSPLRVRKRETNFRILEVAQNIQQVHDVEANIEFRAVIVDGNLFFGFFHFGVCTLDLEAARRDDPTQSLEFFVGQNSGATQCSDEFFSIDQEDLVVILGNDSVVVGEFSFDKFGQEIDITESEPSLRLADST